MAICPRCCASIRGEACGECRHLAESQRYGLRKYVESGDPSLMLELKPKLEERLRAGLELIESGRYSEAERLLDSVAAVDPGYYLLDFARGTWCAVQDRVDEAIPLFREAVRKFPGFLEAHFNLLTAYKDKLDIPNAVRSAKDVVETGDPDDEHVGLARDFLRRTERATRETEGVDLDTYVRSMEVFNEAHACMSKQRWAEAARLLERCIAMSARNPKSHGNLGVCYGKLGRRQEALRELEESLKLDPTYEVAALNRVAVSSLQEGEALPEGPIDSVEYVKDYASKEKSLIRDIYENMVARGVDR